MIFKTEYFKHRFKTITARGMIGLEEEKYVVLVRVNYWSLLGIIPLYTSETIIEWKIKETKDGAIKPEDPNKNLN